MNPIETAILDFLAGGPSSVRPLLARFPRASAYDALRRLRERGAVVPGEAAGTWRLPPGGSEGPTPPSLPPTAWTWPAVLRPYLNLMPSDVHRAIAVLVVLSHMARPIFDRHHASYVLYSHLGLRGKTWLMTALAYMLGVDPAVSIIHAGAETRGSLGVRRRSTGEVAQVRAALATALLGIDERGRNNDRGVQAVIDLLVHGSRTIPLEGGVLEVLAVVMLALNCATDGMDVQAATQLDPPMQRRCHIACLDDVVLDPSFAQDGEERLAQIQKLGPVALPAPGDQGCEAEVGRLISETLPEVVDSADRLSGIDVALLRQQAVAATWLGLSVEEAVALVLRASALLMATLGRTTTDWEARLATALLQTGPVGAVVASPEVELPPEALDLELDYQSRLSAQDRVAREHDAGDPDVLAERLELAAALHKVGLGRRDLVGLVGLLRVVRGAGGTDARLAVLTTMDAAGITTDEAARLFAIVSAGGDALGLGAEDVVVLARGIEEAGLDPREVGAWAVWSMRELGRLDGEIAAARGELREWRRGVRVAAEDLLSANARIAKLAKILERAEKEPALARALRLADTERERAMLCEIMRAAEEIAGARA